MKTRVQFFFAFLLLLFFACKEKVNSIPEKEQAPKVLKDSIEQHLNSHESEPQKTVDLSSKLAEKVARLSQLEHNYQLKNLDTVSANKTMLLRSLKYLKNLNDTLVKAIDLTKFDEVHEFQKAFLKGKKPMYPDDNTYPRVHIEEYIFKTSEAAQKTYDMLVASKTDGRLWMYISKSPHDFFLEENRIYFVVSGGFYMMEIYKDIVEKIKK